MAGDTIVAPASGSPPAAIGIIRISGPETRTAIRRLCQTDLEPRRLVRVTLREQEGAALIDEGLAVFFPAPDSFTGEDIGEFHVHGSRAVMDGVVDELCRIPRVRPADPGEFSRRAFANGKLDLVQAEGIADLVAAETRFQRIQAVEQLRGGLSAVYESWRGRMVADLAAVEASLDFIDEADVGSVQLNLKGAGVLAAEILAHLDDNRRGERLRDGFRVAVLGPPNAGKSSLVNLLARRDAAIVSSTAGTTRDVIEVHMNLGGWPVTVADTAGLRDATDPIEQEGVRRAMRWAETADLAIVLGDLTTMQPMATVDAAERILRVWNKADLSPAGRLDALPDTDIVISCRTGHGLDALLAHLVSEVAAIGPTLGDGPALTRARHRDALVRAARALQQVAPAPSTELAAEELRAAVNAMGRISGRVDVEDVLDEVFASFCIGK